jgi:hypothetical protein
MTDKDLHDLQEDYTQQSHSLGKHFQASLWHPHTLFVGAIYIFTFLYAAARYLGTRNPNQGPFAIKITT